MSIPSPPPNEYLGSAEEFQADQVDDVVQQRLETWLLRHPHLVRAKSTRTFLPSEADEFAKMVAGLAPSLATVEGNMLLLPDNYILPLFQLLATLTSTMLTRWPELMKTVKAEKGVQHDNDSGDSESGQSSHHLCDAVQMLCTQIIDTHITFVAIVVVVVADVCSPGRCGDRRGEQCGRG